MTLTSVLESAGVLLTVMTPLVAVPLTLITFYLRSLREHQVTAQAQLERRLDSCEGRGSELTKAFAEMERDYTTKEEWLRECMHTRRVLEQLTASTVRIETMPQAEPRSHGATQPRRENPETLKHQNV